VHPGNPIYRLLRSGQLVLRTPVRRAGGVGPGPIARGAMVGLFLSSMFGWVTYDGWPWYPASPMTGMMLLAAVPWRR
jgi:hypothetical protein